MGTGKKKIEIKLKEKEEQRMVTFSKRRKGLFKKAHELHCLSGSHVAVLAFSSAGKPYSHGDPSFDATVDRYLKSISSSSSTSTSQQDGGDCGAHSSFESWLDSIKNVEGLESVDDLVVMKTQVEKVIAKLVDRIDQETFLSSLLAICQARV